ncbi:MAG: hypothetical protein Tsb004_20640 [Allomuricauda sp.]
MELTATKYVQTEVGLIPKDWRMAKFSEFITDKRGGASLKPGEFTKYGVLVIPKGGIVRGGYLNIAEKDIQYCSESFWQTHQNNSVDESYLVVVLRDLVPSGPNLGLIVSLPERRKYVLAQGTYGFKVEIDKCHPSYLVHYSNSDEYRLLMQQNMVGSTQVFIRSNRLWDLEIPLPTIEEQKAIAQVLSDTDALIQALEQKIAKKKLIKKGVMQQLLTPKEDWEKVEMKEVMEFANGKPLEPMINKNGAYNLITLDSISIEGKLKNYHKKVSINDNSLRKNDVVTVLSDIAHAKLLGLTDLIPTDNLYVLNQRMGRLRFSDEIHPKFASQFINYNQEFFRKRGQGSSQRHIYKKDFDEFILSYPLYNEQIRIAQTLSDIDEEIMELIQKLSKYKLAKQGMMQQLLTGKIRLV